MNTDVRLKIQKLHENGESVEAIARSCNRSVATVYQTLAAARGTTQSVGRPISSDKKLVSFRLPIRLIEWLDRQEGDRTEALIKIIEKESKSVDELQ